MYTTNDVSRLTGASLQQLRRWHRSGLLTAERDGRRLRYGFRELVAARAAIALFGRGARPQAVRKAVQAIRDWRPEIDQPVGSLRVLAESNHLVIQLDELNIEPDSGQLVFGLSVDRASQETHSVVELGVQREADDPVASVEQFMSDGLLAEANGDIEHAEACYRRALSQDPRHPGALLNLGNLVFSDGRFRTASELYRAATRVAPGYASAWYNLANAQDEMGEADEAIKAYREALTLDESYADAHFNLALALEKRGDRDDARAHWAQYLILEPEGPSAAIAQAFLGSE